jgi:hypothetical protein
MLNVGMVLFPSLTQLDLTGRRAFAERAAARLRGWR